MAANDAGFSASDVHGQPPSLPPEIIGLGRAIMESNAQMYGEAAAPSSGAAPERTVLNPGPENGIGGAGAALAGAQGPGTSSAKRSRVVVCPKCGQSGHYAKSCKAPTDGSASGAPSPHPRSRPAAPRGAGARRPQDARPVYDEEEEEDIAEGDADDVYVEIGTYTFATGDFTWERQFVPAADLDAAHNLRSGPKQAQPNHFPAYRGGSPRCANISAQTQSAWDFFSLLFDDELLAMLVRCTNAYARSSAYAQTRRGKEWRDVDVDEMKVYLALVIYMGVVKVPSRSHVFDPSSIYGQPWVFEQMSHARFDAISRCLHSDEPWSIPQQEREARNKQDPFWQIDAFCEQLCSNFMRYWVLGQCNDIDECTCGYRGKHKCRCFNPSKPHKYHFKQFSWNCSETGYCFAFYWYRGKEEKRPQHVPATLWPIMKLVNKVIAVQPRVTHNGFILTTDNWYTSLHSALFLAQHGIHCCGTLRANKINSAEPPAGAVIKKTGAPPRGTIVTHGIQSRLLPPNWKLFLTAWVDNKPVHILHTWPTAYDVCERNHKQPGVQEYRKKQFPRPTVAKCYNRLMGGTDLSDFFVAAYFTTLRAARWQPRILFHCIQQAVVNAHILYVHKTGIKKEECRLLDFITKLLCELRPKPSAPQEAPSSYVKAVISSRPRPWWNSNVKLRTYGPHFADTFSNPRPTEVGQKRADNRNKCIYCRQHKVLTHCAQCGVYLCLGRCFHDFHTLHDFKEPSEIPQNPNPGPESESDSS